MNDSLNTRAFIITSLRELQHKSEAILSEYEKDLTENTMSNLTWAMFDSEIARLNREITSIKKQSEILQSSH